MVENLNGSKGLQLKKQLKGWRVTIEEREAG